jgi:hypothetical protein
MRAEQACARRSMIGAMNAGIVKNAFRALHLYRTRTNHARLVAALQKVHDVQRAQLNVQRYLSVYDYPKALDVIQTTLTVLATEMRGVLCFRHLATQVWSVRG